MARLTLNYLKESKPLASDSARTLHNYFNQQQSYLWKLDGRTNTCHLFYMSTLV